MHIGMVEFVKCPEELWRSLEWSLIHPWGVGLGLLENPLWPGPSRWKWVSPTDTPTTDPDS